MWSLSPCDGCLGSLRCWVCLGNGSIKDRDDYPEPCPRCDGSGACFLCQPMDYKVPQPRGYRWWRRSTA